jgi:hypothetical protein
VGIVPHESRLGESQVTSYLARARSGSNPVVVQAGNMIIRAVTADKAKRILRCRGKRFIMPSVFLSIYFNPDEISNRTQGGSMTNSVVSV